MPLIVLLFLLGGLIVGLGWLRLDPQMLPFAGVGIIPQGEKVVLSTGATAWLDHPSGPGPFPGALSFHGAHRLGSNQPAAFVLRRALRAAGFLTLSVDHPGYGETPVPEANDALERWSPLPSVRAASKWLHDRDDISSIYAFGHSMGVTDVLRLLKVEQNRLTGAVLFGGGLPGDEPAEEYWYRRFHSDRRIKGQVPLRRFREIRDRYNVYYALTALGENTIPLLFVRFAKEHDNIVQTRDELYELLPRTKAIWDLEGSTHYFSAAGRSRTVIGDTRIMKRLVALFGRLRSCLAARTHPDCDERRTALSKAR